MHPRDLREKAKTAAAGQQSGSDIALHCGQGNAVQNGLSQLEFI